MVARWHLLSNRLQSNKMNREKETKVIPLVLVAQESPGSCLTPWWRLEKAAVWPGLINGWPACNTGWGTTSSKRTLIRKPKQKKRRFVLVVWWQQFSRKRWKVPLTFHLNHDSKGENVSLNSPSFSSFSSNDLNLRCSLKIGGFLVDWEKRKWELRAFG